MKWRIIFKIKLMFIITQLLHKKLVGPSGKALAGIFFKKLAGSQEVQSLQFSQLFLGKSNSAVPFGYISTNHFNVPSILRRRGAWKPAGREGERLGTCRPNWTNFTWEKSTTCPTGTFLRLATIPTISICTSRLMSLKKNLTIQQNRTPNSSIQST